MNGNEWRRQRYRQLKEKGMCVECGKIRAAPGRVRCRDCLDKRNSDRRKDRAFYKSIGICQICKKEPIFGDEVLCLNCAEKKREAGRKAFQSISDEERQKRNRKGREIYQRYKQNGICPSCGKRKIAQGKARCEICLRKNADRANERRCSAPRDVLEGLQLCGQCGKNRKLPNSKLCESCYQKSLNNLKLAEMSKKTAEWRSEYGNRFYQKTVMIRP